MDAAMEARFDKPLWQFLHQDVDYQGGKPDVNLLAGPIGHWLERRHERGDIVVVDPMLQPTFDQLCRLKDEREELETTLSEKNRELGETNDKLNLAVETMLARQRSLMCSQDGIANPESTALFQVHKMNIEAWRKNKLDVLRKTIEDIEKNCEQLGLTVNKLVSELVHKTYQIYCMNKSPLPPTVDVGLMEELETLVASVSMPQHEASKNKLVHDLSHLSLTFPIGSPSTP